MDSPTEGPNSRVNTLRWIARIIGALIIAIFLFFFIGETLEGRNGPQSLSTNAIVQLSFMGIELLGLGLAWKWELFGGSMTIVGFIAKAIVNPRTLVIPLMISPACALLFLLCWWWSRRLAANPTIVPPTNA